ncbi:MAG TPA: WD40 repeat domain-containing protein, partial [Gemmataceae bacterium]|jgi:WD40 repeat protein|nr:WD40 repeat domain-containing protein [Gemmataceae bacterium]
VILAVLYLAGVGFLSAVLPYRPAMTVPRGDFHQMLVGFSPDGCRLAIGPRISHLSVITSDRGAGLTDDPTEVWDVASSEAPRRLPLSPDLDPDVLLAFGRNPEGRRFFWPYVDDASFRLQVLSPTNPWGLDIRNPHWQRGLPLLNTGACQFSPDGRLVARFDADFGVVIVESTSGRTLLQLPAMTESLVFLPDGETAVSAQLTFVGPAEHAHYRVTRWSLIDGRATTSTEWDDASAKVNGGLAPGMLRLSPDGRWLGDLWEPEASTGSKDGLVIWNTSNGQKHLAVPPASWYTFARRGSTLVTVNDPAGRSKPRLRLFDLDSRETQGLFPNRFDAGQEDTPLVFTSPDGELLAIAVQDPKPHILARCPKLIGWLEHLGIDLQSSQGFVALVRASDGYESARLPPGPSPLFNIPGLSEVEPTVAFSSDGRRLAVLADDAIRIWDVPVRRPWGLILSFAAVPPAVIGLFQVSRRICRLFTTAATRLP